MKKDEYYNYKVYDYGNGEMQIRMYEKPIKGGGAPKKKTSSMKDDISLSFEDLETEFENGNIDIVDIMNFIESDNRDKGRSLSSATNRAKNKVYEYARANNWEWFVTWTFNPDKVDSTDYDLVTQKLSQWLKRMKRDFAPDLKYIVVPELHSDGKKYHFHALMSNTGRMRLDYSGLNCVGNYKFESTEDSGNGKPIYNLGNYKYGWTTVTQVEDTHKVSFYISKYITKTLCALTKGKRRYWASKNLKTPIVTKILMSEDEIKKQLEAIKGQVAHESSVSVDLPDYRNKISYYEISVPYTVHK